MAKEIKIKPIFQNAEAIAAIEETSKAVEGLKRSGGKGAKESKKDWGGLVDVFSNLMPRGLQRTIRGFKSTQRSVGRLGKSFKLLNSAMSGLIIGALIVGIELLIENWDKLTDAINGTSQAQKDNEAVTTAGAVATGKATAELQVYKNILDDTTASEEERKDALLKLIQATGLLKDIDTNNPEDLEKVNKAYEEYLENVKTKAKLDKATLLLAEKQEEIDTRAYAQFSFSEKLAIQNAALGKIFGGKAAQREKAMAILREKRKVLEDELVVLAERQALAAKDSVQTQTVINKALADQEETERLILEAKKEAEEAERKAAAARAKRIALAESNAKFLIKLEKDLNEQILLAGIEDEQERAEKVLEIRHKEGLEKARIAGATRDQLLLIEEGYALDLAALKERFVVDEEDNSAEILADQEALREQLRRADLQENEKDVQQAQDLFDERLELAHGNRELEKEAEELFESEIAEIQDKWTQIANDKANAQRDKEIDDAIAIRRAKVSQFEKVGSASNMLFSAMRDMADENSAADKALAITSILISQAVSIAKAIEAAAKSSAKSANPNPVAFAANIAIMVASVLKAFQGVKQILNQADSSSGSVGSGGAGGGASNPTVPLIPLGRQGSPDTNNQAYVVQSQLEGQNFIQRQLNQQTVL